MSLPELCISRQRLMYDLICNNERSGAFGHKHMEFLKAKLNIPHLPPLEQSYDFTYAPYDSLENEIIEFYSPMEDWDQSVENMDLKDYKKLLSWNLGIHKFQSRNQQLQWIINSSMEILKIPNLFSILHDNLDDESILSILYNVLLVLERSDNVSRKELNCLAFLTKLFNSIDDIQVFEPSLLIAKQLLVILKLLGIFTGGEEGLRDLKNEKRKMYDFIFKIKRYGLESTEKFTQKVGLVEYRNYQLELMRRYPGYVIQDPIDFNSLGLNGFVNDLDEISPPCIRKLIDEIQNSLHPLTGDEYLPKGIKETFDILQKNLYISLTIIEKKNFKKETKHTNSRLKEMGELYSIMYPSLGKTIAVLLKLLYSLILESNAIYSPTQQQPNDFDSLSEDEQKSFIQKASSKRLKSVLLKSISGILLMLLKIFKTHHVLEFENLCLILTEQNCQLIFLKLLVSWFPSPAALLKISNNFSNTTQIIGENWLKKNEPEQLE